MFKVFHAKSTRYGDDINECLIQLLEGNYTEVAIVDAKDLEAVYHDTNNINTSWIRNRSVKWVIDEAYEKGGLRSTSVGDMILNDETGEMFIVAGFGFKKIKVLSKAA